MNNLFNQKLLIQKAQKEINLNDYIEKRKIINHWINNLENGILFKSSESELQGHFFIDIICGVLGAINKFKSGEENKEEKKKDWTLEYEKKTNIDGQKADGILGFFDTDGKKDVRVVIELKVPETPLDQRQKRSGDTRTPVEQAFNYAPKYGKNCQWVIVSNFKETRLYRSNDMTEYEVFFLENLKDDLEFQKFVYILSFEALVGTTNKKSKALELSQEYQKNQIEIEKKFYNEYRNIRLHIFENMKKNNPETPENLLLEKVQKLLDRFLFICFCDTESLFPPKSYVYFLENENKDETESLFERFTSFCTWINSGSKRRNIPHLNGGLFKDDEVLNGLNVNDEIFEEFKKISKYDFSSDLNINILGHIFEQSISDIEELKKSISGEEFDQKKSKRKKDGIFYTPQYITKYIVENSIKNWLDDKRKELGEDDLPILNEKDYIFDIAKKNYTKNYRKHIEFWQQYREAVRNIKIIDPACGSGAFLITAFEFLLNYNKYLDDKIFDLVGTSDLFSDRTKEILQNNIFGVDLNKESVEITKLSLWLKTADKNKTLASLENNIKCGNSLIDDPEIAGDLAFNWEKEFPEIFANGGFDIVVGNPPYVLCQPSNTSEHTLKFYNGFEVSSYKIDLYHLFFEKGIILSKNNAYISFITPNTYLVNKYNLKLREFILKNTQIKEIINYKNIVFEDANVDVSTIILKKINSSNESIKILLSSKNENKIILEKNQNDWLKDSERIFNLKKEFPINFSNCISLKEIAKTYFGIQAFDKKSSISSKKENEKYLPMIDGADIFRYQIAKYNQYFNFIDDNIKSGGDYKVYEKERIVVRQIGKTPIIGYCGANILTSNTIYNIFSTTDEFDLKYLFTLLNSKLLKKYWEYKYNDNKNLFPKIKGYQLDDLPLVNISLEKQQPFIEKADKMLSLNKELQDLSQKFQRMLLRKFDLEKLSTKLQEWYLLDFSDFIKELKRLKVKLSLSQESEWEEYFLEEKSKAVAIDSEIKNTDKEIDSMVYRLYDLTDEEIKIIEEE